MSAEGSHMEAPFGRLLEPMCISTDEVGQMEANAAMWREQRWRLAVYSTSFAVFLICWQRVKGVTPRIPSIDYLRVDTNDVQDAPRTSNGVELPVEKADTTSICSSSRTLSVAQPPLSQPQSGSARLLSFVILWACVAITAGGFGPAYVARVSGRPWFFDAIRQIGPNTLQLSTTIHAVVGALWVAVISHQLVTAWFGVPPRESATKTFGWSHRVVGYVSASCLGVCVVTGIYITGGSLVSRVADTHPVILDGIFIAVNFAVGIISVLQGDLHAHKQCMSFAIIWTAWPGALRLCGYARALHAGDVGPAAPSCARLLRNNTPAHCEWITFLQTGAGIGDMAAYDAWLICILAGASATVVVVCGNSASSVDWGVVAGNMIGMLAASVGTVLLLGDAYELWPSRLWACMGCEEPWWCEPSCESDRSLCTA